MKIYRDMGYKKHWEELISMYGAKCFYCHVEIATTIDHVVPYNWDGDNGIGNLVPACILCNAIANDKIFEDVEHKRQYILGQREKRANQRAICIDCLLPYEYRTHSPSLFLCAECYDKEYETHFADSDTWNKWVDTLSLAGIFAEAHRSMAKKYSGFKKSVKLEALINEYLGFAESDFEFAKAMVYA